MSSSWLAGQVQDMFLMAKRDPLSLQAGTGRSTLHRYSTDYVGHAPASFACCSLARAFELNASKPGTRHARCLTLTHVLLAKQSQLHNGRYDTTCELRAPADCKMLSAWQTQHYLRRAGQACSRMRFTLRRTKADDKLCRGLRAPYTMLVIKSDAADRLT